MPDPSKVERKAAIDAYKRRKVVGGIYVVTCAPTGESWVGAANDLSTIKPPKDIEKDNETVAKGLNKFADELGAFRKAAEKQDVQQLQRTFAELQGSHALVNVRDATNDMKKKGYKLGTL